VAFNDHQFYRLQTGVSVTSPHHVEDGDGQPKERKEEDDDVPGSPFGEHQRSVQPNDKDGHSSEV